MIVTVVLAQALAFTNVDVLTMQNGPTYLRQQTVVVDRGVITATGPSSTPIPAGARRIDGTGMTMLPGLADMHVHLELAPERWMETFLKYGVTTVLNLRGGENHLALRGRINSGEVRAPTMYTSGPYVNRPAVETVDDALRAAREQKTAGYDVIKIHGPLGNAAYAALMDSSRLAVVGHAPRNLPFDTLIAHKQIMVAHAEELIYTKFSALDTNAIGDIPQRMSAAGIWLVPTLATFHGIAAQWGRRSAVDSVLAFPDAASLSAEMKQYWIANNPYTGRPIADAAWAERAYRFQIPLVRLLHKAGVRLMTGTDTPLPVMIPGESVHLEIAELMNAGLTSFEAIAAATRNPGDFVAQHIDSSAKVGRVATGYRADLILVRGDPLRDVRVLRNPAMVIARGRLVVGG